MNDLNWQCVMNFSFHFLLLIFNYFFINFHVTFNDVFILEMLSIMWGVVHVSLFWIRFMIINAYHFYYLQLMGFHFVILYLAKGNFTSTILHFIVIVIFFVIHFEPDLEQLTVPMHRIVLLILTFLYVHLDFLVRPLS